jgi:hypothetical protein
MQELTYQLPFERLQKLGRTMGRRAFQRNWISKWALYAVYAVALAVILIFSEEVDRWFAAAGIPGGGIVAIFALLVVFLIGSRQLRRSFVREQKSRTNFEQTLHLMREEGGVRIAAQEIEYFIRWSGITQMLMEPDGVVLSHGNLFFLVPNSAFVTKAGRNAFIRNVYAQLSAEAKAKSASEVGPVLAQL